MQDVGAMFYFNYFSFYGWIGNESKNNHSYAIDKVLYMNVSYMAHVSGKVQGVYFRASSQQVAIDHGLSGYARNLTDGGVEILICGDENDVDKMLVWLAHGPPQAQVDHIVSKQVPWQEHQFFGIS